MAEILGKDLDNWDDSLAARQPFSLSESDTTGPQFMTGDDLVRSAKISAEWREPIAIYTQAYNPMNKVFQITESTLNSTVDTVRNLPSTVSNLGAQAFIELTEGQRALPDVSGVLTAKTSEETLAKLNKALEQSRESIDETIFLLKGRDYPQSKYARRVIAETTANVENRKIVRELYNQAHGIDSSKWYNEAGSIIGAMIPAMVAGNVAFSGARAFGAGRLAAISTAKNVVKGLIGAEMAGQYAEETAAEYLNRTGDKNFENFTAKDASGMMAAAYGAIGAQIEFIGGVEPVFAGALTKVGLRSGALKAALKIGAGEATEELLQGLTETLMRKIDGTSDKTWREGFEESLKGAAWGLFIGGSLGTTAFYVNRQNLVKGIRAAIPSIQEAEAQLIADAMIDTTAEASSQDPSLRNNLRQKVELIYKDADIENKEDRIDAFTDLEYGLITMDAAERGIELSDHELFAGEVNELGWFRTGIPEARRVEIQEINDNIRDLKTQLAKLNQEEEKDWAKIEEIENKLAQANQYVLEKLSDLARDDAGAVRRMFQGIEDKYVAKERKKAGLLIEADNLEMQRKFAKNYFDGFIEDIEEKGLANFKKEKGVYKQIKKSFPQIEINSRKGETAAYDPKTDTISISIENLKNMSEKQIVNFIKTQASDIKSKFQHEYKHFYDIAKGAKLTLLQQIMMKLFRSVYYNNNLEVDAFTQELLSQIADSFNMLSSVEKQKLLEQGREKYIEETYKLVSRMSPAVRAWNKKNKDLFKKRLGEQFDSFKENPDRVMFQNRVSGGAPATYRGAYIPTYRFILRANKMDASTLSHELAHDWFETNFARYRSGKATKEFMRAWGALERALGVEEGAKVAPRKASETFARAYEAWIVQNEDWAKLVNVADKDKDAVEKLMKDYQNDLRDIYNDISNPYFKQTWGKLGELKPELKAWFDRVVNITDLDVMVERGEITEEEAGAERLNRAINTVIENTEDSETVQVLKAAQTQNDTKRYEVAGGNKSSLQRRLSALAREIDENNMLVKENYDTRRDMMAVAEAADNFVKTRLDDALAIINGQMAEVEGLYKEDIYTALERLAIETGDLGLIDELKNSEIANRLSKELGQRVAGFRNFKQSTDLDVVSALKSLDNTYNKALENKKAQKQFNEALDMLDKSLKAQDSIADKELDATLKELECK